MTTRQRQATDADIEAVERSVGLGHGAWDCAPPRAIIEAAWSLLSAEAVASRDEIIEECAKECERGLEYGFNDEFKGGMRVCADAIRALKERAAPQGSTGTAPDKSPGEGPAVAAPVDPFDATFDCHYGGDINRCDKDCKQLGACKRRTSTPSPTAVDSDAAALADEIESVGKGLGILGRSIEGGRELLPEEDALVVRALRALSSTGGGKPFHVCDDHKDADWNQPELDDEACVLCRLFYLEAQESLLEEWQQRAKRAEDAIAEIQRPLDAQMARLNENVTRLNVENERLERELAEARQKESDQYGRRIEEAQRADNAGGPAPRIKNSMRFLEIWEKTKP